MTITSLTDFGQSLQRMRREQGLSLEMLARRVGVNKSTLSRWEGGKTAPRTHELRGTLAALSANPSVAQPLFDFLGRPNLADGLAADADTRPPVSGDLLRALRLRRGWTQAAAAAAAGLPRSLLTKWEGSESWPTADRLHTLCYALGATPDETATLTRGRFLPSLLPQARGAGGAVDLLLDRKRGVELRHSQGDSTDLELELFQIEADAWRIVRQNGGSHAAANALLLDSLRTQITCLGTRPFQTVATVGKMMRRGQVTSAH